jgi:transcriptional regulator with XRE-family HTH domain
MDILAVVARRPATNRAAEADSDLRSIVARNTYALRSRSGLSQDDVSAQSGVRRATLSSLESTGRFNSDTIEKLARFYRVPTKTFFEPNEDVVIGVLYGSLVDRLSPDGLRAFIEARDAAASDDRIRPQTGQKKDDKRT